MWEPQRGTVYAVLFSRVLEVYTIDDAEPVHSVAFDTNQTSFTFVGETQLITSDDRGRLTVFYGIDKKEGVEMRLIKTNFTRFKSLQASPDLSFFSVVTNNSLAFWGIKELK